MERPDELDAAGQTSSATATAQFTRFVTESSARLLRTAWLLTSHREQAQDLTQLAYAKTFAAWRRVRYDDAEAYARRVMVNSYIDWWRERLGVSARLINYLSTVPWPITAEP